MVYQGKHNFITVFWPKHVNTSPTMWFNIYVTTMYWYMYPSCHCLSCIINLIWPPLNGFVCHNTQHWSSLIIFFFNHSTFTIQIIFPFFYFKNHWFWIYYTVMTATKKTHMRKWLNNWLNHKVPMRNLKM